MEIPGVNYPLALRLFHMCPSISRLFRRFVSFPSLPPLNDVPLPVSHQYGGGSDGDAPVAGGEEGGIPFQVLQYKAQFQCSLKNAHYVCNYRMNRLGTEFTLYLAKMGQRCPKYPPSSEATLSNAKRSDPPPDDADPCRKSLRPSDRFAPLLLAENNFVAVV